ncbi:Inositol 2-dehydrogenase [Rubripirellula obstinata]|uniref:Inositol 2-dehydrogenase n=1 Tax=Rubripirellula obstinata TaxID=406547 RepID=A0A5B1CIU7_9BACT|nr:Gfo/Idh/MocA family oxidoreductase [Rubripirellula obstinata]KAA1260182.1 Inositol 2-dehydrogenase [Rubripirellula obstinata]
MSKKKGVLVGAGYFSQFHFDAWSRLDNVDLVAVCDASEDVAGQAAKQYAIANHYTDFAEMLDREQPDFVDIVTGPDSHLSLVTQAAQRGIAIICQKALAPTFEEAKEIVEVAEASGSRLMVHENFRFQRWHREIRRQIDCGAIGDRLHGISFRCRMGDGWQPDAYLGRQPYFRTMPRLMVFETGVHFIDTFRYLVGEINGVYASLNRWNPDIVGEDAATIMFEFESGASGVWDGNRFNETNAENPRLTFGEAVVEGNGGSIRLDATGRLTLQRLGEPEQAIDYEFQDHAFAGDCVYHTQKHFIDSLQEEREFETSGREYLKSLAVVEAVYQSAQSRVPVRGIGIEIANTDGEVNT